MSTNEVELASLGDGVPRMANRNIHTVNETVHRDDVQASIDLLAAYIEDCGSRDYALD